MSEGSGVPISNSRGPLRGHAPAAGPRSFPKTKRVRRRADFVRIQSRGTRVTTRHFVLLVEARGDDAPARLGLVASRKVGNAVVRNRAKRVLREVFRRRPDIFPAGLDVVVIVRAGASELAFAEVESELVRVKNRLASAAREKGG